MERKLLQVLLFAFLFSASNVVKAQIEIIPSKVIWTSTEAPKISSNVGFALGVNGKQNIYLSDDTNQRIGINTAISVPLQGTSHRLDGKLNILYNSSAQNNGLGNGPHLILDEFEPNDYARLRFRNSVLTGSGFSTALEVKPNYWDLKGMAHNGGETSDRFQIAHNGIDPNLSLTGDGKIGFGMTDPIEFFHFRKTDFANLLWESYSPEWKIKNLSNSSAVTDSEINFQNFNNVSVLKVGYRQLPSLTPDKVA